MSTSSKEPASYPSADGRTTVRATIWYPENRTESPRGVVQLVHGMTEYVDRYEEVAHFLTDHGFVVCGNDHVGHGRSVADFDPTPEQLATFENPASSQEWGNISFAGGHNILVNDVITLMDAMQEAYPETPYYMLGHSMGSFITRCVIARRGADLDGAIICGTGYTSAAVAKAGHVAANMVVRAKGEYFHSKVLNGMADGAYSKSIENALTTFDWLNTDPKQVALYVADPACGFMFTAGGYAALMGLLEEIVDPKKVANIPHDLPLFFISGDEDPVGGEKGDGVKSAAALVREAGVKDVSVHLYPGMRHEILKEVDHMKVFDDILHWIEAESGKA